MCPRRREPLPVCSWGDDIMTCCGGAPSLWTRPPEVGEVATTATWLRLRGWDLMVSPWRPHPAFLDFPEPL